MRLASMFLKALNENFEPEDVKRAFSATNQLFLSQESQGSISEEDIRDLLDVCREFFPQTYLTETEEFQQLWSRLENAYSDDIRGKHYR